MTILYGVLITASGCLLLWLGVKTLRTARASKKWPVAAGVVVFSGTEAKSSLGDGPATYAKVRYEYEVEGRKYSSERISIGQYGTGGGGHAKAEAAKYPVGAIVKVFYDPADPSQAVLEPGGALFLAIFLLFFGVIMLPLGLLMLLAGIAKFL